VGGGGGANCHSNAPLKQPTVMPSYIYPHLMYSYNAQLKYNIHSKALDSNKDVKKKKKKKRDKSMEKTPKMKKKFGLFTRTNKGNFKVSYRSNIK
jgi:hypothetical protein